MQQAVTEPVLSASRRRAQAAAQGKAQDKHADNTQVLYFIVGIIMYALCCAEQYLKLSSIYFF